jgi:hypothetical protein
LRGTKQLVGAYGIPAWVGIAIGWLVCGTALWKGGWSARVVAVGFLVSWIADAVLKDLSFSRPQWASFAADTAYFLVILYVALRSGHYWPLFAAAFQLLEVVTYVANILDRHLSAWAYITANVIWTYLILGSIAYGTYSAWRDRRQPAIADDPTPSPGATRR